MDGFLERSLFFETAAGWKYLDQSRSLDERGVAISGARIRSMEDSSKPGRRKAATAFNYQPLIINQFLLYAKCLTRGIFLLSLSKPPLSDRFILLRPSLWPIVTRMIILHPGRGWFPSNFFFAHPFLERHFYSVGEKDKRERKGSLSELGGKTRILEPRELFEGKETKESKDLLESWQMEGETMPLASGAAAASSGHSNN